MLQSLHIFKIIWFLMCLSIYCLNSDSLYGILAEDSSLVEYTLSNGTKSIVDSPNQSLRSNVGLSCYDAVNYRYHYLYQDVLTIPVRIGIGSYDLYNNVSLDIIHLNEHFDVYRGLEDTFLLSCNPNNGDLHIFGTSKLNSQDMVLCSISFKNNIQYSKSLIYNITKVKTYFDFNKLQNDSYINQPHVFDPQNNAIWFAHYFGNYITTNNWIWYNINPVTGAILHQKDPVYFPNFTYLDYNTNNDKIIGGKIEIINDIGQLEVTLYNPIDLSVYRSYGTVPQFYPCGGDEISTIDITNNVWYIINNELSDIDGLKICDKTVISALDVSNTRNISYIQSSKMISRDDLMISMNNIKYYDIINVSITVENKIINLTNDKFVSYTIDMGQIVKNMVNVSDPQLIYLASQLSPNILRIGGTLADYTYYQVGDENPCQLPTNQSHGYYCYTMEEFDNLINYAQKTNSSLVFGLSMGYPLFPKNDSSFWNSSNTKQFLQYLHSVKKYTNKDIYGFELGNELSNNPYTDAEPQADAFLQLHKLITNIWYDSNSSSDYFKLFGFDNAGRTLYGNGNFTYFPTFVNITCDVLTGLTYHVYLGGDSTKELEPEWLDRQFQISNRVSSIFSNASGYNLCANNKNNYNRIYHNVAAGEIAYHSGENVQKNLLNTFIDGFWYLDAMGLLGNLGHAYIFRQTLADNGYGLLPRTNYYTPHPDYFTAVLAKNLFSNKIVGIYSNQQHTRIYSRCLNTKYPMRQINNLLANTIKNGIVITYVNLFFRKVNLQFDSSILYNATKIYLWSLTTNDNSTLLSGYMNLNGVKLQLDGNNKVPNMNGKLINVNYNLNKKKFNVTIPLTSYGFIVFTQTNIDACSSL